MDPGTQGPREEAGIDLINRGDFQDMAGPGEWEKYPHHHEVDVYAFGIWNWTDNE